MAVRPLVVTPSELDFYRSKLLAESPALRTIICAQPIERDFTGAPNAYALDRLQRQYFELRSLYVTTRSVSTLEILAGKRPQTDRRAQVQSLERLEAVLSRAATGYVGSDGRARPFFFESDADAEFVGCNHGKSWDEPCARCDDEQRTVDAL